MDGCLVMRAVIAFSGGMDSTGLLLHLLSRGYAVNCISYDYGQKHKVEIEGLQQLVVDANKRAEMAPIKIAKADPNKSSIVRFLGAPLEGSGLFFGGQNPFKIHSKSI